MPTGDDRSQVGRAGGAAAPNRGCPHRTRARPALPSQRAHAMLPILVDHRRATARPLTRRKPRASALTRTAARQPSERLTRRRGARSPGWLAVGVADFGADLRPGAAEAALGRALVGSDAHVQPELGGARRPQLPPVTLRHPGHLDPRTPVTPGTAPPCR